MSRTLASLSLSMLLSAGAALADVPNVAVDIAPVHSLVERVMQGVGGASLVVSPGASPHDYSLRPSQAAALQRADIVFWTGPDLTPWLADTVDTLAGDATLVTLTRTAGTQLLPRRDNALFMDHGAGEDDHADHDGDGHGDQDPHAWLSPENGAVWLQAIASALAEADPDNAARYLGNAQSARDELAALRTEIDAILQPVRGGRFIVFHDAYQYFESAFDLPAMGAILVSDATPPSPARVSEIQALVRAQGITCVLSEPQFNPGIVAAVLDGSKARTAVLDPLGSTLKPGATLYPQVLRGLARALANCL